MLRGRSLHLSPAPLATNISRQRRAYLAPKPRSRHSNGVGRPRLNSFPKGEDGQLTDIVGLYVDPLAHAVVLSIDEKSQIQALDRTQPGLPIKPGRCQTMTHDYKRHGTTTLFAALSVLDGTVIGR